MTTYTIKPGIAACVDLSCDDGTWDQTIVFLSHEKGAVYGSRDFPLAHSSMPAAVRESIEKHFKTVFDLEHETWKQPGPSPRAVYCDALKPWTVEVNE